MSNYKKKETSKRGTTGHRYTGKEKAQFVKEWYAQDRSVSEYVFCKRAGIAPASLGRWRKQAEANHGATLVQIKDTEVPAFVTTKLKPLPAINKQKGLYVEQLELAIIELKTTNGMLRNLLADHLIKQELENAAKKVDDLIKQEMQNATKS